MSEKMRILIGGGHNIFAHSRPECFRDSEVNSFEGRIQIRSNTISSSIQERLHLKLSKFPDYPDN
jgi:hypothetical protein